MSNLDKKRERYALYKVLIFAGSYESKGLIEKIYHHYRSLGQYDVIYEEKRFLPDTISKKDRRIRFYQFSFDGNGYRKLLNQEYNKIIIAVRHKIKALAILNRIYDPFSLITFVDYWGLNLTPQSNWEIIDLRRLITQRLVLSLPGVPMMAHDVGLGQGEIMEVEVPVGSQFVYKRAHSIYNPQNARIGIIYRNEQIILPNRETIIHPHDQLLLVGKPEHLEILFRQIKEQIGTFPVPFGNNIMLIIDMLKMDRRTIVKLFNTAIYLHKNLRNRKMFIHIINPSHQFDLIKRIYKYYWTSSIDVHTHYSRRTHYLHLLEGAKSMDVGLLITTNRFFYRYSKHFWNLKIPVLKIGEKSVKQCKTLYVILHNRGLKEIIPVIFDLTFQLRKKLVFIEGDPEQNYDSLKGYINHFVKIYGVDNVEFQRSKSNTVWELKKVTGECLIHPFLTPKFSKIAQVFYPTIERSNIMANHLNQFLIPVEGINEG